MALKISTVIIYSINFYLVVKNMFFAINKLDLSMIVFNIVISIVFMITMILSLINVFNNSGR